MSDHVLDAMRDLREELRQRLLQVSEYRALMAIDRSIKEMCDILEARPAPLEAAPEVETPQRPAAVEVVQPPAAPTRANTIAAAFAETLSNKIDQKNGRPVMSSYLPAHRAHGG